MTLLIPCLAALGGLHLDIAWRSRIVFFVVLMVCVPILPAAFSRYPGTVTMVAVVYFVEVFAIIPFINKRWLKHQ